MAPRTMSRFRTSFGYGMLDQIVARIFDFATLWVVLRKLPETDLAAYGVATAMLFVFNLILLTPEAALMRDKKSWTDQGILKDYLRGFLLFAELRIVSMASITAVTAIFAGWNSPYFFACLLALVSQFVQLAELTRLDFRVDLQQRQVFRAEILLKAFLLALVSVLFIYPGLRIYLCIFLGWSIFVALYWSYQLRRKHGVSFHFHWPSLRHTWNALWDFSFWQHLSGVVTYTIYNIDPWVFTWFATDTATVSTYTLALNLSALFFTLPMYLQYMVTIFLVNCETDDHKHRTFRKIFAFNAAFALGQLLLFVVAGEWIGWVFRPESLADPLFYELGLYLCLGVFVLNLTRPVIAELILHAPMKQLLLQVYTPALLCALGFYVVFTAYMGAKGCAIASAMAYTLFAGLLIWKTGHHGITRAALFGMFKRARL